MKKHNLRFVKIILFLAFIISYNFGLSIQQAYAQDSSKLVSLTKQIMEAKAKEELYLAFEELTDLYFKENKYNEYVEFLNSIYNKRQSLAAEVDYYIALTRYYQLKYLEETQNWDEYFNKGNNYRDEITVSAQKTIDSLGAADVLGVYARLILWKFHRDQQDAFEEASLSNLMDAVLGYAKDSKNLVPLKDVAAEFLFYGEKAKAKQLYKIYVDKLNSSDIKDEELNDIASGFYKEGNLDLAEAIYDVYIERVSKAMPKERFIPILTDIARKFSYKEEGLSDFFYAEKIFKTLEKTAGKEAFDEELAYIRAYNSEKAKLYQQAKDLYVDLVTRFPTSVYYDEAIFKIGIIYTYVLRDINNGRIYFEKLAQKEILSPQAISALYQLGLLSHWQADQVKAKEYYNKLIAKAKNDFQDTVTLAKDRLNEIEESKPIEYNLKTFLDVSLKEDYSMYDGTKLELKSHPYKIKKNEDVNINSTPYIPQSGCLQVELQYLWSGQINKANPPTDEPSFDTTYTTSGTKEVNLVVVSPSGVIDRNIDMVDVH